MVSRNAHPQSSKTLLDELAGLYGVLPGYRDSRGLWRESPARSIYQVLAALGAELDPMAIVGEDSWNATAVRQTERAVRLSKERKWKQLVEPVLVFWEGLPPAITVRLPLVGQTDVQFSLALEGGGAREWRLAPESMEQVAEERVGRCRYGEYLAKSRHRLGQPPAARLPYGYHHLRVTSGPLETEATVISAPRHCWAPEGVQGQPWGVFAPLYGLRSDRDWGAGDLAELEELQTWVTDAGGDAIATLPLLAAYLGDPFEPAPYRPVSKLFWNEFYLAPDRTVEWQECPAARQISESVQRRISHLRSLDLVDYAGVMAVKRLVLERLASCFFEHGDSEQGQAFADYLRHHPLATDYAGFRARVESNATGLVREQREGLESKRYHLYCQWQMEEQLQRLSAGEGAGLFLDVPVGVHPAGFDVWRWEQLFVQGMSTGAPPDAFFSLGQNWATLPLHPRRLREQGHEYLISYVRNHMRHSRYIRIDHVMALHRLYYVPDGCDASDGVYVTYPADEQYAVLSLESHRNRTIVVGEDLGTVPAEVRKNMRRHGVLGTWVLQFSLQPRAADPVPEPPPYDVAAIDTHDTFPFAGFLHGDDITARVESGQLDEGGARRELAARRRTAARLDDSLPRQEVVPAPAKPGIVAGPDDADGDVALLRRVLLRLAECRSALLLLSLEDLWGENRPQNLPGTGSEMPNWRRKLVMSGPVARQAIEEAASVIHSRGLCRKRGELEPCD